MTTRAPLVDEEDFEEPEIPEYLIAEQRRSGNRGGASGGRGARGGRSAYQSAMERERYGRGGSGGGVGGGGGGINRYPDVSGRGRPNTPPRDDRPYGRPDARPARVSTPRSSDEPWSDVPPELEAMLRAQVAQQPAPSRPASRTSDPATEATGGTGSSEVEAAPVAGKAPAKPRATPKPAAAKSATAKPAAKPRATRKPAGAAAADATAGDAGTAEAATAVVDARPATKAAAKPRATRKPAAAKAEPPAEVDGSASTAAPKRRSTRKTAAVEPS